ncbi:MAG: hypothetical protein P9L96_02640 [Candidatus Gygaella obscura]|nr:hypothetical protein [Candidatus Gygaella obscura]
MAISDCFKKIISIREYSEKAVDRKTIQRFIKVTRFTPMARNI